MDAKEQFLTVAEVAERLAVHANKIRSWIRSGQLVAIDVSLSRGIKPRYRIAESELELFQKRREIAVAPKPRRRRPKMKFIYT